MRASASVRRLASIFVMLAIVASFAANAAEDAFLRLQGATPGALNYARLADIQVFLDASPTRCSVLLTDGQEIKAFQTCLSITQHLEQIGLVSLPNTFGTVLLAPSFVSSLVSISDGGCRLNLRNGKWVPVKKPCSAVHEALSAKPP
jgi:hypothetical protein